MRLYILRLWAYIEYKAAFLIVQMHFAHSHYKKVALHEAKNSNKIRAK